MSKPIQNILDLWGYKAFCSRLNNEYRMLQPYFQNTTSMASSIRFVTMVFIMLLQGVAHADNSYYLANCDTNDFRGKASYVLYYGKGFELQWNDQPQDYALVQRGVYTWEGSSKVITFNSGNKQTFTVLPNAYSAQGSGQVGEFKERKELYCYKNISKVWWINKQSCEGIYLCSSDVWEAHAEIDQNIYGPSFDKPTDKMVGTIWYTCDAYGCGVNGGNGSYQLNKKDLFDSGSTISWKVTGTWGSVWVRDTLANIVILMLNKTQVSYIERYEDLDCDGSEKPNCRKTFNQRTVWDWPGSIKATIIFRPDRTRTPNEMLFQISQSKNGIGQCPSWLKALADSTKIVPALVQTEVPGIVGGIVKTVCDAIAPQ
jgi:hypothetical protein